MNGTAAAVQDYAAALETFLSATPLYIEAVLCPPALYLSTAKQSAKTRLKLGAQNCHDQPKGAFTGEISAAMVKDAGCDYVILGHSERRADHGERSSVRFSFRRVT